LIAPDHLGRDLGEPARNMLLSLYAARQEGRDLPPTRLAQSAAVPLPFGLSLSKPSSRLAQEEGPSFDRLGTNGVSRLAGPRNIRY
jgi:hypothetical protein